ncbi:MAG: AAA family ATPase [Desulfovibrionaceae bacterium]|nr:AAA family ATPase [Desulfovibrionaceae bacterium]
MIKLAIYGKGGIGKSTVTANLAAAFACLGYKVIQIGCDPKADSTINLLHGQPICSVMDYLRNHEEEPDSLELISKRGFKNILCLETGGPTPGLGCAGRGIITTFQLLQDLQLFTKEQPDIVLYDVLGDVVCGGFAAPIREGYADYVLIVTSGEKMALYAAKNIATAVHNFADRSYATLLGLILNCRNVPGEESKVQELADNLDTKIIAKIPRSDLINQYEDQGLTIIEGEPEAKISHSFYTLAKTLLDIIHSNDAHKLEDA